MSQGSSFLSRRDSPFSTTFAANVEAAYGIPADEFLAQVKASNYVADYPFLEGAYDDSLEGYLYPKTLSLGDAPTVDDMIRALLDQFKKAKPLDYRVIRSDATTGRTFAADNVHGFAHRARAAVERRASACCERYLQST